MKRGVFTVFFLFAFFSGSLCTADTSAIANSTSVISIEDFLFTALQDPSLSSQMERIHFLKSVPGGIAFMEDPEFRMSIDQFKSNQQKYALRFKPRGWAEIGTEKDLQNAMLQSGRVRLDSLLHTALKNRYTTVVEYLYYSEMVLLHEEQALLFEDRENVMKQSVNTPDFDAVKLANAENQRVAIQVDLMELKTRLQSVKSQIKEKSHDNRHDRSTVLIPATTKVESFMNTSSYKDFLINSETPGEKARNPINKNQISLNCSRLITMEELPDRISSIDLNPGNNNLHLRTAAITAETAEAEYELKIAEKKSLISFIETAYNAEDHDDFEKAFSIEFGISIPINSGSQTSLIQRKMNSMKYKSEHRLLAMEICRTTPVIHRELMSLIEHYNKIKAKHDKGFTTAAFNRLMQTAGADPLMLLKLKESMLKNEILLAKLSHMIYTKYVDLLDITGKLSEKPLINYLTITQEEITGQ